ncbi:MAG: tRNA (adenosine(37)-N6)-threonylcarbamoyltransferase complex ATPase subunit type 1 TsaE [Bacteroidia bacterium]
MIARIEKDFLCKSVDELERVAEEIVSSIQNKKLIALYGEMGAGKTTLIQALCKKLNVTDAVTSPTFAIMNEYATADGEPVYHFDFYRINSVSEAFDLGYEQFFFNNNFCFIEWAEKISNLLPENRAEIHITVNDGIREIKLIA